MMLTPRGIHENRFSSALFLPLALGFYFLAKPATAAPALPIINTNNIVNVTTFGAVGDGITTNTVAIQNAINCRRRRWHHQWRRPVARWNSRREFS